MTVTFSKGEDAKKRVYDAALALFFEQGYDATTMRQIVQRSGVLNGSVYHAFKNKDAIFELVFNDVMDKLFENFRPMELDVLTYSVVPLGYELKFAFDGGVNADLLYHANRSWVIFNNLVDRMVEYVFHYADAKGWPFSKDRVRRGVVTILGATRALIEEYVCAGSDMPLREAVRQIASFCSVMFLVPTMDLDTVVDTVMSIIEDRGERFSTIDFGYSLKE